MTGTAPRYVLPQTVVRVNGTVHRVIDVRREARIAAETDQPFTGTYGVVTTVCDITWMPTSGKPDHPWLPGWFASDGATVTVDLEWPDKTARRFTGTVLYTTFDVSTGETVSRCVGREVWMDRQGRVPPLAYAIHPHERHGNYRYIGMSSMWITGHLLRQAGFSATAPLQDDAVVFLSNEGSAWAIVGEVIEAHSSTRGPNLAPYYRETSWGGIVLVDPYIEARGTLLGSSGRALSMCVDLGDPRSGGLDVAIITATSTSGDGIGVELDGANIHMLSVASGSPTREATLTRVDGCTRVQVSYDPATSTLEMYLDRLAPAESVPAESVSIPVNFDTVELVVDADYADVGAVQVFRSLQSLVTAPRTVRFRRNAYDMAQNGGVGVVPYIRDRNIIDVLAEQTRSEWFDLWVDETGVVQVCDRDVLDTQAPVKVITDGWLDGFLDLPQNGFRKLPDGTDVPGRPYPLDNTGITASTNTLDGYSSDSTGPYAVMVNSGSQAAAGQRSLQFQVPIRQGEYNTFYAETRSPTGDYGALRARYYDANGNVMGPVEVTGEYGGGTMEWAPVQVKLGKAPAGAKYARVDAINAHTFAFGGEIHWRNFTTYGPAVALLALTARTPGLGSYARVVVNRRVSGTSLQLRKRPRLLYWDGGNDTLEPGDYYEQWAVPDSRDERTRHWLAGSVDTDWYYAGAPGSTPLNNREGTVVGGQLVDEDQDEPVGWVTPDSFDINVEFVDYESVKISGWVADTLPENADVVETVPYQDSPTVGDVRKRESTMQVRGYGYFDLFPGEPVTRTLGGRGPDYEHPGGFWLQSDYQANQVADKLADRINNPRAVIDTLDIPLVDVNLGDRVIVALSRVAGVTVDIKVIGLGERHRDGRMSVTAQLLDAEIHGMSLSQITNLNDFLGG